MSDVKSKRGGVRPGAGRKKRLFGTGEPLPKRLIIDKITEEILLSVGDGNASLGCMKLAYAELARKTS